MANAVIGALRVTLGIDTAEFQDGVNRMQSNLKRVGSQFTNIGKQMSVAVTAPLAGFAGLSLKTAGDFEASMNRVQAATGASAEEFDSMRDLAREMGRTTQFMATDAADGIEMLAKNGLSASQILGGALEASMKLSAASGGELSSSADLATDVMLNFGKEAGDLKGVVDGVSGVLLTSKFGFDDYRLALGQAGGVAGGLGVTLDDFNSVIAATSGRFASGSDAGTSFKTFLQRLVPASGPAKKAMEDLGLEFFTANGSMKSMAEVADELRVGFAGLSDEAKNDALSTIFGTDALRTAIGLMEQGATGIDNLSQKISEVSADEQAEARMQGLNGAINLVVSAFQDLQLAIADSGLLEFATDVAKGLADLIRWMSDFSPELLKWSTIVGGVLAASGPVLIGLGLLVTALGAISAPAIAVGAGLAAVVGGLTVLYKAIETAWPYIEKLGSDIWAAMKEGCTQAVQAVTDLGQQILEVMRALPVQMLQIGMDIMNGLKEGIMNAGSAVVESAKNVASSAVNGVKSLLGIHSPSRVMHEVGNNIVLGLNNGMDELRGDTQSLAGSIGSTISSAFQGVIDGSKSVGDALKDLLKQLASTWANNAFQALFGMGGGASGGGIFGGLFSNLFGNLPMHATGGHRRIEGSFA